MISKLILPFFLLFNFYIAIYPSKKENNKLFDYCFSLEKLIARNSIEKSKNISNNAKNFAKDLVAFGINNSKGAIVNEIIDQYKSSNKLLIITFVPNRFYCLAGYWIEELSPGTLQSILYEKSKKIINKYIDTKKEADSFIREINSEFNYIKREAEEFIEDINSEYKSIKKEIYDLF